MKWVGAVEVDVLEKVIVVQDVPDELVDEAIVGIVVLEMSDVLVVEVLVGVVIEILQLGVLDMLDMLEVELGGVASGIQSGRTVGLPFAP